MDFLQEIEKYQTLIQMVRHIKTQKFSGNAYHYQLEDLRKLADECKLLKIDLDKAGNKIPLSAPLELIEKTESEHDLEDEIEKAFAQYNLLHSQFRDRNSDYIKEYKDESALKDIKDQLKENDAVVGLDYVIEGLKVRLVNSRPAIFSNIVKLLN